MTPREQQALALLKEAAQELRSYGHCRQPLRDWYQGQACECRACSTLARIEEFFLEE